MAGLRGWLLMFAMSIAWHGHAAAAPAMQVDSLRLAAPGVSDKPLRLRVWLPPDYERTQARYPVLYINDGQDMEAVGLQDTLQGLYARYAITRIIVVAIDMPPDRMAGYGLFDRDSRQAVAASTKYGAVGANAYLYAQWLTQAVLPAIDARYRTLARADGRALLGWSLGALSGFGIGWQYPETFGRVGAFSPSFWLSAENGNADAVQATRIAHALVDAGAPGQRPKLFFGVGNKEETDDRDADGVIDVLDDTRDLVEGWTAPDGSPRRGARASGHLMPPDDVAVYLLEGGRHDQPSWARMLPVFLRWAYAGDAIPRPTH